MEKIVTISGMKCAGCATTVKEKIEDLTDVITVTVSIEEKRASIESTKEISVEEIGEALSDTKFTVE